MYKIIVDLDVEDVVDFAEASQKIEDALDRIFGDDLDNIQITDEDIDGELDLSYRPGPKKSSVSKGQAPTDGVDSLSAPAQGAHPAETQEV